MIKGYKIEKFENIDDFITRIKCFDSENIRCTDHTLFRLSEKQRQVFSCDELKEYLTREVPLKVGLQYNGNYVTYYSYKEQKTLKIIISLKPTYINVVTFMIISQEALPKR